MMLDATRPSAASTERRRSAGTLALAAIWAIAIALTACAGDRSKPGDRSGSPAASQSIDVDPKPTVPPLFPAPSPGESVDPTAVDDRTDPDPVGQLIVEASPDVKAPQLIDRPAVFPLDVSADRRNLVDQRGAPFLVNGDAAWSMLVQLDLEDTDDYLATRREQGFNTVLVNLIEHRFSDDPPNNAFGDAPFLSPGDFSQPNPAYFDAARRSLEHAAEAGFLVLLAPAYLGYDGGDEGWYEDMLVAGPTVLREYGRFVGEQFGDLDNVIWVQGGDFTIPLDDLDLVEAVRSGIIDSGSQQLHTAHWSPETSGSDVPIDWLDLNTTYTYGPVHVASLGDNGIEGLAHVVIESQYEADQFDDVTSQRLRAQVFESVLTGAIGSVYGHGDIWQFSSNWRTALDADGAGDMTHAAALFQSMPWFALDPSGLGDIVSDQGTPGDADFVTVAGTADRSTIAAYLPLVRDLQLDLAGYAGTVAATWLDPTSGTWVPATTVLEDDHRLAVTAPGRNGDGDLDWVLVVRDTN